MEWEWGTRSDGLRIAVRCGGEVHHVRWDTSGFATEDHDVDDERVLESLGGDRVPCISLQAVSGRTLAVPSFNRGDEVVHRRPGLAALSTVTGYVCSVRSWASGLLAEDQDPVLRVGALMAAEAACPYRTAIAPITAAFSDQLPIELDCHLADADEPPSLEGWIDCTGAFATAALPLDWLTNVALPGRALVDGAFVVAETDAARIQVSWDREEEGLWAARLVEIAA